MADHTDQPIMIGDCRIRLMRGGTGAPCSCSCGGGGAGIWLPAMARLARKFDVIVPEHPRLRPIRHAGLARHHLRSREFLSRFPRRARLAGRRISPAARSAAGLPPISPCAMPRASPRSRSSGRPASRSTAWPQVDTFLISDEQRIRDLFYDQELAEAVIASSGGRRRRTPRSRTGRRPPSLLAAARYDPHLRKWLHRIKVPTLLVWGADDRLFPPDYAFAYQRLIPGAKTRGHPECGHLPHVEQADAFAPSSNPSSGQ